jgi:putative ABC transport system substrate-binding protein
MRRREFIAGLGSAAAWPLAAQAQRPIVPVIGFLSFGFPNPNADYVVAFRQGLADAGYVEGRNVAIEYRWRPLAAELAHRPVDAIFATGANSVAHAARAASSTIPIVFHYGADPVKDGLVPSFGRPGGNITGVASLYTELGGKRLGLLHDMVPGMMKFAFLSGPPNYLQYQEQRNDILTAARMIDRQVVILEARSDYEYEAVFTKLIQAQAGGLIVGAFTFPNTNKILALAAHHKIPAIYPGRGFVAAGGLMSYGPVTSALDPQAGTYVGRILKGEKPNDLPVFRANKFELFINLKTAKALGIEVPETLLATADELIETEPRSVRTLGWNLVPTITVVSGAGDPRLPLVDDAVAFWNETLAQPGTPFRLGASTQVAGPMSVEDLKMLSNWRGELPESLKRIEGNIVVALSEGEFISPFQVRSATVQHRRHGGVNGRGKGQGQGL